MGNQESLLPGNVLLPSGNQIVTGVLDPVMVVAGVVVKTCAQRRAEPSTQACQNFSHIVNPELVSQMHQAFCGVNYKSDL